jgi:hypothetical protein
MTFLLWYVWKPIVGGRGVHRRPASKYNRHRANSLEKTKKIQKYPAGLGTMTAHLQALTPV